MKDKLPMTDNKQVANDALNSEVNSHTDSRLDKNNSDQIPTKENLLRYLKAKNMKEALSDENKQKLVSSAEAFQRNIVLLDESLKVFFEARDTIWQKYIAHARSLQSLQSLKIEMGSDLKALLALIKHLENAIEDDDIKDHPIIVSILKSIVDNLNSSDYTVVTDQAYLAPVFGLSNTRQMQRAKALKPRKKTIEGAVAKEEARILFKKWSAKPSLYKNKAAFNRDILGKEYCDSMATANKWLNDFIQTEKTSPELLSVLKRAKKL